MAHFVRLNSTDPAVKNPVVVISDLLDARWVQTSAELKRIERVLGRSAPVVVVDSLAGLAARWVGPVPPKSAATGKAYPIPAGWVQ